MRAELIGRLLGAGVRAAGRVATQQLASAATAPAAERTTAPPTSSATLVGRAATAGHATKAAAKGFGGFFRSLKSVGRKVMLEVTGVFYLLFVLVAGSAMWRTRPATLYGPFDRNFLAAVAIVLVFLYLSVSSFWRARSR